MLSHRASLMLFYLFEFEQNVRRTASLYSLNIQQETKRKEIFTYFFSHI